MKAYVLSEEHGTIQIGCIVYCLQSRKSFQASRKGLKGLPCYDVQGNSWTAAMRAAEKHKNSKGGVK